MAFADRVARRELVSRAGAHAAGQLEVQTVFQRIVDATDQRAAAVAVARLQADADSLAHLGIDADGDQVVFLVHALVVGDDLS